MSKITIAVSGAVAQRPGRPGHAWVFLSYLLGLRRLGYEVLFLDRLDHGARDGRGAGGAGASAQARWLARVMSQGGLDDRYAALIGDSGATVGLSRRRVIEQLRSSALLLNFNGFLADEELLAAAPRRVYLDIDPGFAQIWEAEGLADPFAGHEDFVAVAANIGAVGCHVPTGGRRWIATLPPVVLDCWPVAPAGSAFTSVGSWRGPFGPLQHRGVSYGLRVHEFRRFFELPAQVRAPFEVALEIDPEDARDRRALGEGAWTLVDPLQQLASFASYRRYVRDSMAEISIAKGMYVGTRGGWFSDRSATYLAAGKPVIALDTGFGEVLPTGRGLLSFGDLGEAIEAAEDVHANLREHSAAARAIAEEHLDSDLVLGHLLERLGVR